MWEDLNMLGASSHRPLIVGIVIGCASLAISSFGERSAQYRFEEGEPLAYHTDLLATNQTSTVAEHFQRAGKSARQSDVALSFDYQLMPIAREERGVWKMRVVLDQAQYAEHRDGETKTKNFSRSELAGFQINASQLLKLDLTEYMVGRAVARMSEGAQTNQSAPVELHDPANLFEEPILAWFAPNGELKSVQYRKELQHVMPGFDLKECLQLATPVLPAFALETGVSWTREVTVDLPATPLPDARPAPMKSKLTYVVRGSATVDGKRCLRIGIQGKFSRDGLTIPIAKEEIYYLLWTVSISKITDEVEGEFVYDLDAGVIRSASVLSTYRFTTVAGRKADNYRGRITTENTIQTRLLNKLVSPAAIPPATGGESSPAAHDTSQAPLTNSADVVTSAVNSQWNKVQVQPSYR